MTERCSFCGGPIDPTTRACRACGRLHPSASGAAAPARPVSNALMKHCPTCGQALPMEARFCAHCGRSFSAELARLSATPEGPAQASSSPFAPAGPQSGAPSVPGAYAGSQSGAPIAPGVPGGPQSGVVGASNVPGAPAGPQSGISSVPGAPGGPQGGPSGVLSSAPVRGVGKAAGQSLQGKLLGTAAGKVILAVLAVAVVAAGTATVILTRGGSHAGTTPQSASTTSRPPKTPTPTPLPAGIITEFPLPTGGGANSITAGPDGNLWFVESHDAQIGRITPQGQITEFPLPGTANSPWGITVGPDGNLWFTVYNKIGYITPAGQITTFPLPETASKPYGIAAGPDGNLWFTESAGVHIGRITLTGQVTEFPLSSPANGDNTTEITAGPDGNLWFTDVGANAVGRITPAGQITEFPLRMAGSLPAGITKGPDGNLWFVESYLDQIGRITPDGQITEFPLPSSVDAPDEITAGPNGNLWFTEGRVIGRFSPGTSGAATPTPGTTATPAPTLPAGSPGHLAAAYQGTAHNTTFNVTGDFVLTDITQNQQAISGKVLWGGNLVGNGPFTGTIQANGSAIFAENLSDGTITFTGTVASDGSFGGTYATTSSTGGAPQQGTWQTMPYQPAPNPHLAAMYHGMITNFTANVTTTLMLTSIVQNQQAISGKLVVGPGLVGSGQFTGTIAADGSVMFTNTATDGSGYVTMFSGFLFPDGSLSGTYTISGSTQNGAWQTTPG